MQQVNPLRKHQITQDHKSYRGNSSNILMEVGRFHHHRTGVVPFPRLK
jgi:hypothetical protein